jgi:hypothetical protein
VSIATLSDCRSWLGLSAPYDANDTFVLNVLIAAVDRLFADFLGYSISQATRTEYYPPRVNLNNRDNLVDGYERSGTNKVVPVDRYRNERRVLMLRHLPVTEIVSVYENPDAWLTHPASFPAENLLTAGDDYSLDIDQNGASQTGFLIRNTGPWSVAERCVKVTYTAGYTAEQLGEDFAELRMAFLNQVQVSFNTVKIHRMAGRVGGMPGLIASESLGDWSASYDTASNAMLYGLQTKLAPGVMQVLEDHINYSAFVF